MADHGGDLHPDAQGAGRQGGVRRGHQVLQMGFRQGRQDGRGTRLHSDAGFGGQADREDLVGRYQELIAPAKSYSRHFGARVERASPESITAIGSMDFGSAHPARVLRTWAMILPNSGKPEFGGASRNDGVSLAVSFSRRVATSP